MSETASGLMSQLQKLQSEIAQNSESKSNMVSKSEFEKFQNEQQKFNLEMIETFRMMRDEMTRGIAEIKEKQAKDNEKMLEELREQIARGMAEISAEIEEKQQNFHEGMLENLETIEDEMKEKQEEINEKLLAELKPMSQYVAQLKRKEYLKTPMQIFVRNLDGKTSAIHVMPDEIIGRLKLKIQDKVGILPKKLIFLIYQGKILNDDRTLDSYGIQKESTLHLVLRHGY